MMYKANVSFCGLVNMTRGQVKEIDDPKVASSLLKAGYISEVKASKVEKVEEKKEAEAVEAVEAPKRRGRKTK